MLQNITKKISISKNNRETSKYYHQDLKNSEKISCLRLVRSKGLKRSEFFNIINKFSNANSAIKNINDYLRQKNITKPVSIASEAEILKELEDCQKIGARIITFYEDDYPELLKEIPDPPLAFTFRGNINLIHQNIIAIIGTRNASFNGCKFAEKISRELGEENIIIASGLARGIDQAAHRAAINSGTIAVIGGGIDNIYPHENKNLYQDIIEQGLLISEYKIGSPPKANHFPQRNRIISGLSLGVVVIEAKLRSGSLITSRFALEQNREIFAVPGSPFDPRYQGTNLLIKQGAKLIENKDDILTEITEISNLKDKTNYKKLEYNDISSRIVKNNDYIKNGEEYEEKENKSQYKSFCGDDTKDISTIILNKINYAPILIQTLIDELDISAKTLNIILTELEIANKIIIANDKIHLNNN